MLESILSGSAGSAVGFSDLLICTAASLILGIAAAFIYMYHNTYTRNFVITLALLPVMVQIVIMMVNGNLGTGVAVLGAFSLIRFRSVPGTAREIGSIFFAMALGLACGMGYLVFAGLFVIIIGLMTVLLYTLRFGEEKAYEKHLKITIPETLDYDGIFEDLFRTYTKKHELNRVHTTNMGSLFELHYLVVLKDDHKEKEFLDALRCRNGNLTISCGRAAGKEEQL